MPVMVMIFFFIIYAIITHMQTADRAQTFVFFGIVGSGKGTQVKLLQKYLEDHDSRAVLYVGTGEIFRQSSKNTIRELLNAGKLIPDEITNDLVSETIAEEPDLANKHIIFDGYPRTPVQSQKFEQIMRQYGRENVKIIYIALSQAEAMKRNLLRGRHDDTEEGLAKRFEEYEQKVIPAMNYFKDKDDYTIYTINGEQSVEDVHQEIISKLGPRN